METNGSHRRLLLKTWIWYIIMGPTGRTYIKRNVNFRDLLLQFFWQNIVYMYGTFTYKFGQILTKQQSFLYIVIIKRYKHILTFFSKHYDFTLWDIVEYFSKRSLRVTICYSLLLFVSICFRLPFSVTQSMFLFNAY